jgi:hypothetical protein
VLLALQDTPEQGAREIPARKGWRRCNARRGLPPHKTAMHLVVQLHDSAAHYRRRYQLLYFFGNDFRKGCLGRRMAL